MWFRVINISTHLLCCRVSLLTSRKPAASARLVLVARGSGVLIGGVTCSRSYGTVTLLFDNLLLVCFDTHRLLCVQVLENRLL